MELGDGTVDMMVEVMVFDSTTQKHKSRKSHGEERINILGQTAPAM